MTLILLGSAGLAIGGPVGAVTVMLGGVLLRLRRSKPVSVGTRPILMMMLVELRSGHSVLSALQSVTRRFPQRTDLARATRVATVAGLDAAVDSVTGDVRSLLVQLLRAQQSGSSAADMIRRVLESDMAHEKARLLAKTRTLPIRLMVPMTLLILPGVILLAYGPSLVSTLQGLVEPFG